MMEVALFGAGRIGKIHAGNVARQPGVRLQVRRRRRRARPPRRSPRSTARRSTAPRPRSADPAVGAVVIGSSTDTHADLIMRAAAAGKAIFCEKPVDLDVDRARTCAEAGASAPA